MAQQYIKIFDDTVLKQSINQGYETQRTNSRLGKFTMGELAFTRDTARLFVGNSSTLNLPKDSGELIGGSIVGNKYLGLIDSKPLTHFFLIDENGETVESSVHFPLNYESDTLSRGIKDSDGVIQTYTEKALLKKDSKFRTDKNNGWDKNANYNETYDAYNGDFVFDTFNNALILFDKNIKPIAPETDPNWVMNNQVQKFKKPDGSIYEESGSKTNYSKYRTRLQNVSPPADGSNTTLLGNPNYPIYGNGYVVMRIIEPDGITLGYKEKKFNQNTGSAEDGNYSHNYLEIKNVPAEILVSSFDSANFIYNRVTNKIELGSSTTSSSEFPNTIHISKGPTFTFSNTNDDIGYVCVLNETVNGETKNLTQIKKGPSISIKVNGTTITHQITPNADVSFDFDDKQITDDTNQPSTQPSLEEGYQVKNPFFIGDSTFIYNGTGFFSNGNLISQEKVPDAQINVDINQNSHYAGFVLYDSSSKDSTFNTRELTPEEKAEIEASGGEVADGELVISGQFVHPYLNVGLNYLKKPEPIAWGTGGINSYGQFFINPFVISPGNYNSGNFGAIGTVEPNLKSFTGEYTEEIAESLNDSSLDNLMGIRIPDHAQSIICELHVDFSSVTENQVGAATVVTAADWENCQVSFSDTATGDINTFDFTTFNVSQVPSLSEDFDQSIKFLYHKTNEGWYGGDRPNWSKNQIGLVEIPLYRDKNNMKYFNFGVSLNQTNGRWVMRAIGYRL